MENLSWNIHINNVCSKAYGRLGFLRKKLAGATADVKLAAYKTFIRPVLLYALVVWSPHQYYLKKQIEKNSEVRGAISMFPVSKDGISYKNPSFFWPPFVRNVKTEKSSETITSNSKWPSKY